MENTAKLMELQNKVQGDPPVFVQPHRSILRTLPLFSCLPFFACGSTHRLATRCSFAFVVFCVSGEGIAYKVSEGLLSSSVSERLVVLFNDALLWCTDKWEFRY
jgi:hypothetical protein